MSWPKAVIKRIVLNTYITINRLIRGIDESRVLFSSFDGRFYSDNPKQISMALHELAPELKITWAHPGKDEGHIFPDYVDVIDTNNRFAYYGAIANCGTWVTNFSFPNIKKHRKQRFIQTWHGDRGFKKVLYDAGRAKTEKHYFRPESVDGFCDLAIAGSDYGERVYRSAFRYRGEVLKVGSPRDDRLMNIRPSEVDGVRRELGIKSGEKLLLYAPTLRKLSMKNKVAQRIQDIDLSRTLDALERSRGGRWICLVRAHPSIISLSDLAYDERIRNVSDWEDMADLLLVADMLITDYSSSAGDFALTHRPMILYQSDIQQYLKNDRDLYFNIEDSPYLVASSQFELEEMISKLDTIDVVKNCEAVLEFYGTYESGRSARIVAERICKWINRTSD